MGWMHQHPEACSKWPFPPPRPIGQHNAFMLARRMREGSTHPSLVRWLPGRALGKLDGLATHVAGAIVYRLSSTCCVFRHHVAYGPQHTPATSPHTSVRPCYLHEVVLPCRVMPFSMAGGARSASVASSALPIRTRSGFTRRCDEGEHNNFAIMPPSLQIATVASAWVCFGESTPRLVAECGWGAAACSRAAGVKDNHRG